MLIHTVVHAMAVWWRSGGREESNVRERVRWSRGGNVVAIGRRSR